MTVMVAQVEVGFDRESPLMGGQTFENVAEMVVRISRQDGESLAALGHEGFYELRGLPVNMGRRSMSNYERANKPPRPSVYPTWMTSDEAAVTFSKLQAQGVLTQLPTLDAILAYMRVLEESGCYGTIRIVSWLQF